MNSFTKLSVSMHKSLYVCACCILYHIFAHRISYAWNVDLIVPLLNHSVGCFRTFYFDMKNLLKAMFLLVMSVFCIFCMNISYFAQVNRKQVFSVEIASFCFDLTFFLLVKRKKKFWINLPSIVEVLFAKIAICWFI